MTNYVFDTDTNDECHTTGFVRHRANYHTICTRTHHGCSVCRYGCRSCYITVMNPRHLWMCHNCAPSPCVAFVCNHDMSYMRTQTQRAASSPISPKVWIWQNLFACCDHSFLGLAINSLIPNISMSMLLLIPSIDSAHCQHVVFIHLNLPYPSIIQFPPLCL